MIINEHMTCGGYDIAGAGYTITGDGYTPLSRVHCNGCAEAAKLRAERDEAVAELEAERRSLTWERDEFAATRARLVEAVGLLRTLDKGDLPLAQVSTFLASPKSAAPAGTAPAVCAGCPHDPHPPFGCNRAALGDPLGCRCQYGFARAAAPAQEVAPPVPPMVHGAQVLLDPAPCTCGGSHPDWST